MRIVEIVHNKAFSGGFFYSKPEHSIEYQRQLILILGRRRTGSFELFQMIVINIFICFNKIKVVEIKES